MSRQMDLSVEQGNAILWGSVYQGEDDEGNAVFHQHNADPAQILEELQKDAVKNLPPGTRYEIRRKLASWYGREKGMAWYYHPSMKDATEWGVEYDEPRYADEGGYFLVGQYVT